MTKRYGKIHDKEIDWAEAEREWAAALIDHDEDPLAALYVSLIQDTKAEDLDDDAPAPPLLH